MLAVLLSFLGSPLMPETHEYEVDCIEINRVFDNKGDLILTQAILWKRDESDGKMHNCGWKLLGEGSEWPWRNHMGVVMRHHNSKGIVVVTAPYCRVRSTRDDMERVDTKEFWAGKAPNLFSCDVEDDD